jgi:hypothetical protein
MVLPGSSKSDGSIPSPAEDRIHSRIPGDGDPLPRHPVRAEVLGKVLRGGKNPDERPVASEDQWGLRKSPRGGLETLRDTR